VSGASLHHEVDPSVTPTPVQPFLIGGLGAATGPISQSNAELEHTLDTSDQWIRERTGIAGRTVGGTTSGLAIDAARAALHDAGLDGSSIGAVVVATSSPDRVFPSAAAAVCGALGSTGAAVDTNAACAGFVHALLLGATWIELLGRPVLVIGSDTLNRLTDPTDRSTAILFGDAAGAVVLLPDPSRRSGVIAVDAHTAPEESEILRCGTVGPIEMEGQAVFKVAVRAVTASVQAVLGSTETPATSVDVFVPHQANERITRAVADRVGFEPHAVVSDLATTGNTSAASIPLALSRLDQTRLTDATVIVSGFGAGMTWATALVRWTRA